MSRHFEKISPPWKEGRDQPNNVLYPINEKGKQVKNASRLIQRAMELNMTGAETNALYDLSGRYKVERTQAFVSHRQVNKYIFKFFKKVYVMGNNNFYRVLFGI